MGVGLLAWALLPDQLRASTRVIVAWDLAAACYLGMILARMAGQDAAAIERRAAASDEGRGVILALVVAAVAMSLGATALELSAAKADHSIYRSLRVALAFATVAISWLLVHVVFALHYAHEYHERSQGRLKGGLRFPGDEAPDYWDFLHFAIVIGVACQTADIDFTSKPMRRLGTIQGVVAFTFNTGVLALTINLLAAVFG